MKKRLDDQSEQKIRRASKQGAVEDIIHVGLLEEGPDARDSEPYDFHLKLVQYEEKDQ